MVKHVILPGISFFILLLSQNISSEDAKDSDVSQLNPSLELRLTNFEKHQCAQHLQLNLLKYLALVKKYEAVRERQGSDEDEDEFSLFGLDIPPIVPGIIKVVATALTGNVTGLAEQSFQLFPTDNQEEITAFIKILTNAIKEVNPPLRQTPKPTTPIPPTSPIILTSPIPPSPTPPKTNYKISRTSQPTEEPLEITETESTEPTDPTEPTEEPEEELQDPDKITSKKPIIPSASIQTPKEASIASSVIKESLLPARIRPAGGVRVIVQRATVSSVPQLLLSSVEPLGPNSLYLNPVGGDGEPTNELLAPNSLYLNPHEEESNGNGTRQVNKIDDKKIQVSQLTTTKNVIEEEEDKIEEITERNTENVEKGESGTTGKVVEIETTGTGGTTESDEDEQERQEEEDWDNWDSPTHTG